MTTFVVSHYLLYDRHPESDCSPPDHSPPDHQPSVVLQCGDLKAHLCGVRLRAGFLPVPYSDLRTKLEDQCGWPLLGPVGLLEAKSLNTNPFFRFLLRLPSSSDASRQTAMLAQALFLTGASLVLTPVFAWDSIPFSPAAVLLAVRTPYLSVWLPQGAGTALNDAWATFWNGNVSSLSLCPNFPISPNSSAPQVAAWTGYVKVDGTTYAWLGAANVDGTQKAAQKSLEVSASSPQEDEVICADWDWMV